MAPVDATSKCYVSVTGLQLKSLWHYPRFVQLLLRIDAKNAPGNIHTSFTQRHGVHHTLTVWDSPKSMRAFFASGPHAAAMKFTSTISAPGGTKVYSYFADAVPTWEEALQKWEEHATFHGKKPVQTNSDAGDVLKTTRSKMTLLAISLVGVSVLIAANLQILQTMQSEWTQTNIGT